MAGRPFPELRAAARGFVAAMAMSGVRSITASLDLMEETPPRKIVERHAPRPIQRLPEDQRQAVSEAIHWSYGAAGGLVYGLLPTSVRAHPLSGPGYGLIVWAGFELGIGPLLGIQHKRRKVMGRIVLGLDHLLYGLVVGGRLAPDPDVTGKRLRDYFS